MTRSAVRVLFLPMPIEDVGYLLAEYRNRVAAYPDVDVDYGRRWRDWCRTLLTYGGHLVVPPLVPERHLDVLLAEAEPAVVAVRFVMGEPSSCHANASAAWSDGEAAEIATGYALSDDGLWVQHSWGVDIDGTVVETTAARASYVGVTLAAGLETLAFVFANNQSHLEAVLASGGPRAAELLAMMVEIESGAGSTRGPAPSHGE